MQKKQQFIGARLLSALPYITRGGRVADIGTDHAYLPIHLLREGIISGAVACDINAGPIESARMHIAAAGFSDRIDTLLTDGLHGVEQYAPDDILIFGMGGDLIVKILSEAPWIKNERIGLILQPMSRVSTLRQWLCENGFLITGETLSFEDKYYQTLAAHYTGVCETYTETELAVGRLNIGSRPPHFEGFVRHEIKVLNKILAGKAKSENADTAAEERLKEKLEELL
ncbi:MAG: SAM-dependent methyltransferase [Clostridia bacterium]|nr:SAM-dependent methyltransferase [Clostridia bacterium]